MEGSYKIFNIELKQTGYIVCHNVSVGGKKHLYVDAVTAVTAIPKENRGHNGYKFWVYFPWNNSGFIFHGVINNKKCLGY